MAAGGEVIDLVDSDVSDSSRPAKKARGGGAAAGAAGAGAGAGGGVDLRGEAVAPTKRASYAELLGNGALRVLTAPSGSTGRLLTDKIPMQQQRLSFGLPLPERPAAPALPRGVVLLREWLSVADSHALLAATDAVSLARPFEIPQVRRPTVSVSAGGPAFSSLYMCHAGAVWDGTTGTYSVRPRVADALGRMRDTPAVPAAFLDAARRALDAALEACPGAFERLPFDAGPDAFAAILNYYAPRWGSLSQHADTAEPCLKADPPRLWPVVSFSIGDAATFTLYPDATGAGALGEPLDLELRSGDVLLFGGAARLIRHEIKGVKPEVPRPKNLRMVAGRLNITLRGL